jgi:hypothetical protein
MSMYAGSAVGGIGDILGTVAMGKAANTRIRQLKQAGKLAEGETYRQGVQTLGKQRAAFSKSGVDPDTGSALDIQADEAGRAHLATRLTRYGYLAQAYWIRRNAYQQGVSAFFQSLSSGLNASNSSQAGKEGSEQSKSYDSALSNSRVGSDSRDTSANWYNAFSGG